MRLKGTNSRNAPSTPKTRRPIEFKLRVIQLVRNEGCPPENAFRVACDEHDLPLAPSMGTHPHSHLHLYDQAISRRLERGDRYVEELVRRYGLAEERGETASTE
jgi:hypothetical protein